MTPRALVNGADVSNVALVEGFSIERSSGEAISTAAVTLQQDLDSGNVYGTFQYGQKKYGGSRFFAQSWAEWQPLEIRNSADAADVRFAGLITAIRRSPVNNRRYRVELSASDYGVLLDRVVITQTWTDTTDREIAKDLAAAAAAHGITASDATVAFTATLPVFELKDATLREGYEQLAEMTGARWHVDPAKVLHWYKPGTTFAPFNLSDTPNGITQQAFSMEDFQREFGAAANRVTVLGGFTAEGAELRTVREDAASIASYGVLEAVSVEREISSGALAIMAADAQLATRAHPQISGRALVRRPGLKVGQTIGVKAALYGVNANYIIHGLRERYSGRELVWEVEWGARPPDIVALFRKLGRETKATPVAAPPTGLVEDIVASELEILLQTPAIQAIIAENVVSQINAGEVGTITAGSIQGAFNLGSVELNAQDVSGVFISDQLSDDILDSLRLVSSEMAVIERWRSSTLPALPSVDYPIGALILRASAVYGQFVYGTQAYGAQLYENKAEVWTPTSASTTTTGLLRARDIESIYAHQITGLIIASQINTINTDQLVGQVQADQIHQINAESIIAINANTVTLLGQWVDGHIQAVSASKLLAGTISATVTMTSPDIRVTGGTYNLTLNNLIGFTATAVGTTRTLKLTDAGINFEGIDSSYFGRYTDLGWVIHHGSGSQVGGQVDATGAGMQVASSVGTWSILSNSISGVRLQCIAAGAGIEVPSGYVSAGQYVLAGQLRLSSYNSGGSVPTPATYNKGFPVYNAAGGLIGIVPIY